MLLVFDRIPLALLLTTISLVCKRWRWILAHNPHKTLVLDRFKNITHQALLDITKYQDSSLKSLSIKNSQKLSSLKNIRLRKLNSLVISNNSKLTRPILAQFIAFSKISLTSLNLSNIACLDGKFFSDLISACQNLTNFTASSFDAQGSPILIKQTSPLKLTVLTLDSPQQIVNTQFIQLLNKTPSLTDLDIHNSQGKLNLNSVFSGLEKHCLKLEKVNVNDCFVGSEWQNINNRDVLTEFISAQDFLREFSMKGFACLMDRHVSLLAACWSNLTRLDIRLCFRITDQAIIDLTAGCPNIEILLLGSCPLISGRCLLLVFKRLVQLKCLDLSNIPSVNDQILKTMSTVAAKIVELDVSRCNEVSVSGVGFVVRKKIPLTFLNISLLPLISNEAVRQIRTRLPKLKLFANN